MENTYWNRNGKHQTTYNKLWDELVPLSGPAKTKEGELLRAMSRLYYRWYNDGDKMEYYLSAAAADSSAMNAWGYIFTYDDEHSEIAWDELALEIISTNSDAEYEKLLEELADTVIEYVNSVPGTPNDGDFTDLHFRNVYDFEIEGEEEDSEDNIW